MVGRNCCNEVFGPSLRIRLNMGLALSLRLKRTSDLRLMVGQ